MALSNLVKQIRQKFWKTENMKIKYCDEEYIKKRYRSMKMLFFVLLTFYVMAVMLFYVPSFFPHNKILPFAVYQPSWMTVNQLLCLELFVTLFSGTFPMLATLTLLMTVSISTQVQFRLLVNEIVKTLKMDNGFSSREIKRIVDQHNFLLR